MKQCECCGTTYNVQKHHIFFGTANRKVSERHGFIVNLCLYHHTGEKGIHHNREMQLEYKRKTQAKFEETSTREEFIELIGRSYL
jgi:hypothetical protein